MPFKNRFDLHQGSNKFRAYEPPEDLPDDHVYFCSSAFESLVSAIEMHDQWALANEVFIETTEPPEGLIEFLRGLRCHFYSLVGKFLQQKVYPGEGLELFCAPQRETVESIEKIRHCQER